MVNVVTWIPSLILVGKTKGERPTVLLVLSCHILKKENMVSLKTCFLRSKVLMYWRCTLGFVFTGFLSGGEDQNIHICKKRNIISSCKTYPVMWTFFTLTHSFILRKPGIKENEYESGSHQRMRTYYICLSDLSK